MVLPNEHDNVFMFISHAKNGVVEVCGNHLGKCFRGKTREWEGDHKDRSDSSFIPILRSKVII